MHLERQSRQPSATFQIKDLGLVHRLGFGAMRITGPGIWGYPADCENARYVVRRAVELGVDLIDTADAYGPGVSEEIIAEAIHPYVGKSGWPIRIATKVGLAHTGPNQWFPVGRPEYLRQQTELSLRRLKVDQLDLLQLHRIDPSVRSEDQFGELAQLRQEGKVRALGLSEVTVRDIELANQYFPVATVQNRYNLLDRASDDVLDYAESHGIGFIPWAPISAGELAVPGSAVARAAEQLGATAAQVALAWLLRRSPTMLPIPGTASVEHLEENLGAAGLALDVETQASLGDGGLNWHADSP